MDPMGIKTGLHVYLTPFFGVVHPPKTGSVHSMSLAGWLDPNVIRLSRSHHWFALAQAPR